jgi:hypothetical protein
MIPACCGTCVWLGNLIFEKSPKPTAVVQGSENKTKGPEPKYAMPVGQLSQEWKQKENRPAADAKYKGEWIRVTGRVNKKGTDWLHGKANVGRPFIFLEDPDRPDAFRSMCYFPEGASIDHIAIGQNITIVGKCGGMEGIDLAFTECFIAP